MPDSPLYTRPPLMCSRGAMRDDPASAVERLCALAYSHADDIDDILDQGVRGAAAGGGYREERLRALYASLVEMVTPENIEGFVHELGRRSRRCSRLPSHVPLILERCGVPAATRDIAGRLLVSQGSRGVLAALIEAISERGRVPGYLINLMHCACARVACA